MTAARPGPDPAQTRGGPHHPDATRAKAVDVVDARMHLTADVGAAITADDIVTSLENAGLVVIDSTVSTS